jgi:predicted secreted Zn-dependent protease
MMRAAERSAVGLKTNDDPSCYKTRREAQRRIGAVSAQYEAKQRAFDVREHRDGGHVEHLVMALIKP